jgi:hypothetical protein
VARALQQQRRDGGIDSARQGQDDACSGHCRILQGPVACGAFAVGRVRFSR